MNDRPTPDTDAEVNELVTSNTYNMVTASFARRLERERDEAREAAEKAKAYKRVLKGDNAKLRSELDELDKRLIEVSQFGVVAAIEREDLRTKLDDALAFNMRASRDASLYASMLHEKLEAERALADRLAQFIDLITDALGPYQYLNGTLIVRDAYHTLAAWKEARK